MVLSSGFGRRVFFAAGWKQGVLLLALAMAQAAFGPACARPLATQAARTEAARQDPERAHSLNVTVVTATKTEAGVQDLPQAMGVLDVRDLHAIQAGSIVEALDWLPGVRMDAFNPYLAQPAIRGLDRGRVVIQLDGVNQTVDSNKGMALSPLHVDPFLVKQIEVQKGSSSALYGSGGMGGVIAIERKSVQDLLQPGRSTGAFLRPQYNDLNDRHEMVSGVYGTSKNSSIDWLVTTAGTNSDSSKKRNTMKNSSRKIDAGLGWNIGHGQRFDVKIGSGRRKFVNAAVVNPDIARDHLAQISWRANRGDNINLKSSLSHSRLKRESSMKRAGQQNSTTRRWQFDIQNTQKTTGAVNHEITYGFNSYRFRQSGTVDGKADAFIAPAGKRTELGLFVQDRIDWSTITLVGALRYNRYKMDSQNNPDVSQSSFLPGVGVTWHIADWLLLHANYSRDFRAPSIDDLYTTAYGMYPGMDIIANPNLKAESSRSRDVGLTLRDNDVLLAGDSAAIRLDFFQQDITDMISVDNLGLNPVSGNQEFSSINKDSVGRRGAELQASYRSARLLFSLGMDYLREKDNKSGKVTRLPRNLKMRFSYGGEQGPVFSWLSRAASRHKKTRGKGYWHGYMVHDARLDWRHAFGFKGVEVNIGLRNVFNRKYHNHFGAKGAGRNFHIGFLARF